LQLGSWSWCSQTTQLLGTEWFKNQTALSGGFFNFRKSGPPEGTGITAIIATLSEKARAD